MAKSCTTTNAAAPSHGDDKRCTHTAHHAERVADDDTSSSSIRSSNQDGFAHEAGGDDDDAVAALAVWDDRCEQDEPMAQVLEAIRLGLDKETKSRCIRDCDYMKQIQRHGMKNAWRVKICRWMFETGKAFELSVDTVGCAISYMDQFLSVESVDKIMMQLLSLVCVFSASKVHDPEPISLDELKLLCESRFSKQDFCRVEMHLLRILNWELNPPNTFTFARDFVHALALQDADEIMESVTELLKFVAEDYRSITCKTSAMALAAVQLIIGSCSSATSLAASHSTTTTTDEFTAAFNLLQRVYVSTSSQQQQLASQQEEVLVSRPALDVTSSPIAVENHPHMSIMNDIESLKHMLITLTATAAASSGTPTQRALFISPVKPVRTLQTKQYKTVSSSIASKKRQRAASLSLAH